MNRKKFAQPDVKILPVENDQKFANILKIRPNKEKKPRPEKITCQDILIKPYSRCGLQKYFEKLKELGIRYSQGFYLGSFS